MATSGSWRWSTRPASWANCSAVRPGRLRGADRRTLCVFARHEIDAALERQPALARALLRRSQEDLHQARQLLALGSGRSATDQVGALLLAPAEAASDPPCHPEAAFALPLMREKWPACWA